MQKLTVRVRLTIPTLGKVAVEIVEPGGITVPPKMRLHLTIGASILPADDGLEFPLDVYLLELGEAPPPPAPDDVLIGRIKAARRERLARSS